jgi:hypothetical protein
VRSLLDYLSVNRGLLAAGTASAYSASSR